MLKQAQAAKRIQRPEFIPVPQRLKLSVNQGRYPNRSSRPRSQTFVVALHPNYSPCHESLYPQLRLKTGLRGGGAGLQRLHPCALTRSSNYF